MNEKRCKSLKEFLYKPGFQNLVQGVHALNSARKSLCDLIEKYWRHFIATLPDTEKEQLGTFIQCLNKRGTKLDFANPSNENLGCGHKNCGLLHTRLRKLSYVRGDISAEQKVESLLQEKRQHVSNSDSCFSFIWELAHCFIGVKKDVKLHGRELNAKTMIQLMKYCRMFAFKNSERIYGQVLEDIDKLIYGKDLLIAKEDLEGFFVHLLELLSHWQKNCQSCSYGIEDIEKMQHDNADCENFEYPFLVKNVLKTIKSMLDVSESESDLPANIKSKDVSSSKELISSLLLQVEEMISEQEPNELLELQQKVKSLEEENKKLQREIAIEKSKRVAKMKETRELEDKMKQLEADHKLKKALLAAQENDGVSDKEQIKHRMKENFLMLQMEIYKMLQDDNVYCENLEYKLLVKNILEILKSMMNDSERERDLPENIKSKDLSSSKELISSLLLQVEEMISVQEPNEQLDLKHKVDSFKEEHKTLQTERVVKGPLSEQAKNELSVSKQESKQLKEYKLKLQMVIDKMRSSQDEEITINKELQLRLKKLETDLERQHGNADCENLEYKLLVKNVLEIIKCMLNDSGSESDLPANIKSRNVSSSKKFISVLVLQMEEMISVLEPNEVLELQQKIESLEAENKILQMEKVDEKSTREAKMKENRELQNHMKQLEADHSKQESDTSSSDSDDSDDDSDDDDYDAINAQQSVTNELGNNPLHIDLYQRALSRGFETDNTVRVNVVGNFAQGKTSLTRSLVGRTCQTVQSTNGVEINHCKYFEANGDVKIFQTTTPDNMDIINRIAEVAKNEEENVTDESNITEAMENTDRENKEVIDSASNMLYGKTQAESMDNTSKNTKSSLTPDEVKKFSTFLTSKQSLRKVDGNLEIWDFAGQFVFYATHTIFHSNRAVYLLVFDLSKPLSTVVSDTDYPMESGGKTMEHFIKFWMNSIHSYVGSKDGSNPPVILVGTHKDQLAGREIEKIHYAEECFEKIRTLFENTPVLNHIHTKDFIVNSTDPDDKEIEELRKEIIHIRKHSKLKVPARWIALEKELVQIRYKKIIPFSKVVEIDSQNEFPLKEEEQIKLFLLYHHRKGSLFFFDEEPLSRYVVLDTQYLIDALRCIVTSEKFCRKEPQYRSLWKLLQKEAKLTMELIEKCFDSNSELSKFKNEILMFMQRHYIISEVSSFDEITGKSNPLGWYIVPIFLRNHSDSKTLKEFLTGKKQTSLRFLMAFQYSPVVQIVYCRLIAAMVAKWPVVQIGVSKQRKELLLYENLGVFRLDSQNAGVVELQQNRIEMRVINLCTSQNVNNTADKFRRFAESVVISEINKLRESSTFQGKPFQTCFRCNNESHGLNASQEIFQLENLKGKSIEPCLDMPVNHVIHAQKALSEWFEEISKIGLTEDCQFNEKQLSKIAQSIGYNWELLGSELGLSIAEINRISMDNGTSSMRIYKMMLKWKAEQQENATVNTLLHALKSTKSLTVEWDEVRNIVEQIASTQEK